MEQKLTNGNTRLPTGMEAMIEQVKTGWKNMPGVLETMGFDELRKGQREVVCSFL